MSSYSEYQAKEKQKTSQKKPKISYLKRPKTSHSARQPQYSNSPLARPKSSLSSISLFIPDQSEKQYSSYLTAHRPKSSHSKLRRSHTDIKSHKSQAGHQWNSSNVNSTTPRSPSPSRDSERLQGASSRMSISSMSVREEMDIDNGCINAVGVANGVVG